MLTITYTNGVIQVLHPSSSFYSSTVQKRIGTKLVTKVLKGQDYKEHIMESAQKIAQDCTTIDKQCCPVLKILIQQPNDENQVAYVNIPEPKEEPFVRDDSYKKEQKRLRNLHKNDFKKQKPMIMHFWY